MQKKERDQYAAILTEQAWLLTDFFTGQKRFFLLEQRGKSQAGMMDPSCQLV